MENVRAISFQHQQFQEWFASHEVETLIKDSANGDRGSQSRLRLAILDQPVWEESVLFAVERVSNEAGGAGHVAEVVRLAQRIDPMLAAEMVFRSSPEVWEVVRAEITSFVERWHRPGTVDRAVRYMIMTGRPEFESFIWPLAASEDTQIQLPTLRAAPRFRPTVLGANASERIQKLPDRVRVSLLACMALESGVDGMDMATQLASSDPTSDVQIEVLNSLRFRRADRHVARLLELAHDATWAKAARRGYVDSFRDPEAIARLRSEILKALDSAADPLDRLRILIHPAMELPDRDTPLPLQC